MSRKIFTQVSVLALFLLALLVTPLSAQAGGVCGGTFVVEKGETLETIAAMCGTTISAITAANPGISGSLTVGQTITVPGANYTGGAITPVLPAPTATSSNTTTTNNYYNTYNNYYTAPSNNYVPPSYSYSSGTYIVQYGDTFSGIASRFGVSIYALWTANPYIQNINLLYAGQTLYIPGSSSSVGYPAPPTPTAEPIPLSYGVIPPHTAGGEIRLSNQANADVYVSLQGTTGDGSNVINEYPVSGTFNVKVPAGWYVYVAWVGGQKFVGEFKLGGGTEHSITFYSNRVVVQ